MNQLDPRCEFLVRYVNNRKLDVSVNALGWEDDGIYNQWVKLGYDNHMAVAAVHWHMAQGGSVVNASPAIIDMQLRGFLNESTPADSAA